MRRLLALIAVASLATVPLSAQTQPPKRKPAAAASIEGDVYLLNKAGEVKKGAAGTVGLAVPGSKLEALYHSICATQKSEWDSAHRRDSIAVDAAEELSTKSALLRASIDRLIALSNDQEEQKFATLIAAGLNSPTGMAAHYSFSSVQPGTYFLLSTMRMGDRPIEWAVPVKVASGEHLRVDLDNNNVDKIALVCDKPFPLR